MSKRTPLFDIHKASQGKIVEFADWEMPVYYTGVIDEHETVRHRVGLFDVSHMGEIEVRGRDAVANLDRLVVSNIQELIPFQVKYSALCYANGGVVDDITIYRLSEDLLLLCTNASNTLKDYQWIQHNLQGDVNVIDRSSEYAQFALQGPKSCHVLERLTSINVRRIKYYRFLQGNINGVQVIISRTGYTGEDGFELYFSHVYAAEIWEQLIREGKEFAIKPVGLGARDSLRLEMAFPLYNHELNDKNTLLEAGLQRVIDFKKPAFIGKEILLRQMKEGVQQKLVGFEMAGGEFHVLSIRSTNTEEK